MPERLKWSFAGPFGQFDRAQLQRGFFRLSRSLRELPFAVARCLPQPVAAGRTEFSEGQVKTLAAEYKIKDFNDAGEPIERNGRPRLFPEAIRE